MEKTIFLWMRSVVSLTRYMPTNRGGESNGLSWQVDLYFTCAAVPETRRVPTSGEVERCTPKESEHTSRQKQVLRAHKERKYRLNLYIMPLEGSGSAGSRVRLLCAILPIHTRQLKHPKSISSLYDTLIWFKLLSTLVSFAFSCLTKLCSTPRFRCCC